MRQSADEMPQKFRRKREHTGLGHEDQGHFHGRIST